MKYLLPVVIATVVSALPQKAISQSCNMGPADVAADTNTIFLPWSVRDIRRVTERAFRDHDYEFERVSDNDGEIFEATQTAWSDAVPAQMWKDHVHPGVSVRVQIRELEDSTAFVLEISALCAVEPEQNGHDHGRMEEVVAIVAGLELTGTIFEDLQGRRKLRSGTASGSDRPPRVISCPALPRLEDLGIGGNRHVASLQFVVEPTGRIARNAVSVDRGLDPELERIAIDTVLRCRFRPGRVGGEPVAMLVGLELVFRR